LTKVRLIALYLVCVWGNFRLEAEVQTDDKDAKPIDSRKQLEKEYLDLEAKVLFFMK